MTNSIEQTVVSHASMMWAPLISVSCAAPVGGSAGTIVLRWGIPDRLEPMAPPVRGVQLSGALAPPDTVLRADLDEADILDAAWRLGAWDCARTQFGPLGRDRDPRDSRWGVLPAFAGLIGYELMSRPMAVSSLAPAALDVLLDEAATRGYVTWAFKVPRLARHLYRARWLKSDTSLDADGSRAGTFLHPPLALAGHLAADEGALSIYQLGRRP
jgi:hypothetical protein